MRRGWVQSQASPCAVSDEQSGIKTSFSASTSVFPCLYYSKYVPYTTNTDTTDFPVINVTFPPPLSPPPSVLQQVNSSKTKSTLNNISTFSSYRTVNAVSLGYKNQLGCKYQILTWRVTILYGKYK
jgi:hypothetical protein